MSTIVRDVKPRVATRLVAARSHLREPLFRNAYALMLSQGGSALLGVVFWAVAARRYPASVIGENVALIAAMQTVSTFAQLDLASMILKFLPMWRKQAARAVAAAYAIATAAAIVLSVGFVAVVAIFGGKLSFIATAGVAAMFCVAVVTWGIFAIQDGVLTGLGATVVVPIENTSYGLGKLVLLLAFAGTADRWGVFVAWNIPMILAIIPINLLIFRRYLPRHRQRPLRQEALDRATMTRYVAFDYVGGLCGVLKGMAMPLIVASVLGPTAAGHFYIPWTLVVMLDTVNLSVGASLLVESSYEPGRLAEYARRIIRRNVAMLGAATFAVIALAPLILQVFGHSYSADGTDALRLLVVGVLGRAILNARVSIWRAEGHAARVMAVILAATVVVIGSVCILGELYGLNGVAAGWSLANLSVAAAVAPSLIRTLRSGQTTARPSVVVPEVA